MQISLEGSGVIAEAQALKDGAYLTVQEKTSFKKNQTEQS